MTMSPHPIIEDIYRRRAFYREQGLSWPKIQSKLNEEFGCHPNELKKVRSEASKAGARKRKKRQPTRQQDPPTREVQLAFDFFV